MHRGMAESEGGVMIPIGDYMESYRAGMKAIKQSEQLTPKEYGMRLQRSKKKRKVIKRGK